MPEPGKEETVRVVALDRSFHVSCYKCEVAYTIVQFFFVNRFTDRLSISGLRIVIIV